MGYNYAPIKPQAYSILISKWGPNSAGPGWCSKGLTPGLALRRLWGIWEIRGRERQDSPHGLRGVQRMAATRPVLLGLVEKRLVR